MNGLDQAVAFGRGAAEHVQPGPQPEEAVRTRSSTFRSARVCMMLKTVLLFK